MRDSANNEIVSTNCEADDHIVIKPLVELPIPSTRNVLQNFMLWEFADFLFPVEVTKIIATQL